VDNSSDADSAIFDAKTSDYSKFMGCPHGQSGEGLSQSGHFADKGEGCQIFASLCGRLLCTAPNSIAIYEVEWNIFIYYKNVSRENKSQ